MFHTKKWFINRIGKRIFRDWFKCCKHCDEVAENGLIVSDEQHADYIWLCQMLGDNNKCLNYRDKK